MIVALRKEFGSNEGAYLLGMLLAALNHTIVSTALPRIAGDLGGFGSDFDDRRAATG